MDYTDGVLYLQSFFTITLAIIVLFVGKGLNLHYKIIRNLNIPEPVVGGLLFAVIFAIIHYTTNIDITFDLSNRDFLLIYFFTTIGLSANFSDIAKGGKLFLILLAVTILYMIIQDIVGVSAATMLGVEPLIGLLGGTVSLIGGHGTAIAWAPTFTKDFGIENAMEMGIAAATIGLILASLMGGPVASYLIKKHKLEPVGEDKDLDINVGIAYDDKNVKIDYFAFLHAILAIHISIAAGFVINEISENLGLKLPEFVTALFAGILYSSFIVPILSKKFTWLDWSARHAAVSLVADISLGVFLAMSLMSMQLWIIADLAGPLLIILIVQLVVALFFAIVIIFKLMGKNYDAAVISSGFSGISLGSTATAMANMTAVTEKYGASALAFLIVPLVCAFFMDIVNAAIIQTALSFF